MPLPQHEIEVKQQSFEWVDETTNRKVNTYSFYS